MDSFFRKLIATSYYILFFTTPLILYPQTSEIFEFNKMVFVYSVTTIISALWISRMIFRQKIVFNKSPLDIPILIFLISLGISTYFSIDQYTSLFGYYSRFHGGLLSWISYSLLYWGFVSNTDKKVVYVSIKVLLLSSIFSGIYGVLQHFGIDDDLWVQDVRNRIFSTFGQPNWIAAWFAAITPLAILKITNKDKVEKLLYMFLPSFFLVVIIYSKSRSGFLGFFLGYFVITIFLIIKNQNNRKVFKKAFINFALILITILLVGSPWTHGLPSYVEYKVPTESGITHNELPEIQTGGSQSIEIRKIVWKGAFNLWRQNPLLGTGPETFGYSYYSVRPKEHNLTSEWDFLYNKAHNEYLHIASTTGTIGILSYLLLFISMIYVFLRKHSALSVTLFAGFLTILFTNAFGFSVVPIGVLTFTMPAMAFVTKQNKKVAPKTQAGYIKYFSFLLVILITLGVLFRIYNYWRADVYYTKAQVLNNKGQLSDALVQIETATRLSPKNPYYVSEMASIYADMALTEYDNSNIDTSYVLAKKSVDIFKTTQKITPYNIPLGIKAAGTLVKLSIINEEYLLQARDVLEELSKHAPTDAKISYNLGLSYLRTGDKDKAKEIFENTIYLKPNYKEPRFALGLIYKEEGNFQSAREQFEYIINFIDPNNLEVKRELQGIIDL